MLRFTAALLAYGLLAGCASVPPEQQAARDQVRDFALEARFALRVSLPDKPPESSGGRLDWEHKNGRDRILIANPLGVGIAEIETSPTLSILRTGDGRHHESSDPDTLIEQVTGQRLPIRQLPGWLLGRGDPAHIDNDASGRPVRLAEAGWQVDYVYPDSAPGALPERVTLRRADEIELRLRIEAWKTAP
jgi:outer membrane lipoprotein LolB